MREFTDRAAAQTHLNEALREFVEAADRLVDAYERVESEYDVNPVDWPDWLPSLDEAALEFASIELRVPEESYWGGGGPALDSPEQRRFITGEGHYLRFKARANPGEVHLNRTWALSDLAAADLAAASATGRLRT